MCSMGHFVTECSFYICVAAGGVYSRYIPRKRFSSLAQLIINGNIDNGQILKKGGKNVQKNAQDQSGYKASSPAHN